MKTRIAAIILATIALSACNNQHTQQGVNWQAMGPALQNTGAMFYNNSEAYRRAKVQAKGYALGGNRTIQNNFSGGMYGGNPYGWAAPRRGYGAAGTGGNYFRSW